MSNLINKAKDALSSNKDHSTTTSGTHGTTTGQYDDPRSTNTGPHSSNLMNKGDPRVDSDRDNRNDPTSRVGGYGTQGTHTGTGAGAGTGLTSGGAGGYGATGGAGGYGSSHTGPGVTGTHDTAYGGSGVTGTHGTSHGVTGTQGTSSAGYDNPKSTNAGPHGSNVLNKIDPRVDSDRDNRNDPTSRVGGYGTQDNYGGSGLSSGGAGAGGYGGTHGTTGTHGTAGAHHATTTGTTGGIGGTHGSSTGQYDNPRSTNAGPHSSNLMNKGDPRVDSDRDNRNDPTSRVGGYGTQDNYGGSGLSSGGAGYGATGATGTGAGYGTTGTHGTGVGHGTTGTHGTGGVGGTHGSSTLQHDNPQSTNAGPHKSNLLNKLDPRVDSDRDGR